MIEPTKIPIESPGVYVAVVKKDPDGWRFLLVQRAAGEYYGGYWGFVTGGKMGQETVAQVVVRELKKELALAPLSMWATEYVVHFYEPEYDKIWMLPLIVAVVESESEVKLSEENSDFRWLPSGKARHLVSWKNLERMIEEVTDELAIFPARNWVQITA